MLFDYVVRKQLLRPRRWSLHVKLTLVTFALLLVGFVGGLLAVNAKIDQSSPTPPVIRAPSMAYWRCRGDKRCSNCCGKPRSVCIH